MLPKFFDIHSHPNFAAFAQDRDEVVRRALDNSVFMNVVGTQRDTSQAAVELAEKYSEGVYATIGLHPIHTSKSYHDEEELGKGGKEFTSRDENFDYEFYKKLAASPKVVAIGECGLDYFRNANKKQEEIFSKQIELANEVGKPLMLHIRNGKNVSAYRMAAGILKEKAKVGFNFHFFAGNLEEARLLLDLGAIFSFTGVITFTSDYDEIIKYLPLEKIMAEPDCPFVAPVPHRGKRNEPVYVIEVVKKIAEIRGENLEKVRKQLLQNSFAFFNLSC